jgi:hypothetical protein
MMRALRIAKPIDSMLGGKSARQTAGKRPGKWRANGPVGGGSAGSRRPANPRKP